MSNKQATLELGTKPVGHLLLQYAVPAIIAMTASSLYNIIDSIFIGKGVGPMAISGLAITFPFMNLTGAFGAAIGVGASTLISVRLGQKDYITAQRLLGNAVTLKLIIGVLLTAVCLFFLDPILQFFGASPETLPYAREYMEIILAGNTITHLYFGMNSILRSVSKPRMAMYITIFTVVLNTILDPIFIYPLGMGIRGAALATVISQFVALCWQTTIMSNKKELLHLKRGIYKLKGDLVKGIIGIGISPFAMNACACIVVIFINNSLVNYGGDIAVGAYGIGNRIAFMFVMICMGINQGMQPIAGYNFGAKHYDRMMRVVYLAIAGATAVMTAGWLIGEFMPEPLVRLFIKEDEAMAEELVAASIHGLRINMAVFPIIGYQMVITNFFQSIGKAKISIFLSLSRQMLMLLPLLAILPPIMGVDGVWTALPASDALSAVLAAGFMIVYMRRFKALKASVAPANGIMATTEGHTHATEGDELSIDGLTAEEEEEVTRKENENMAEAPRSFAPWSSRTPRYTSLNS